MMAEMKVGNDRIILRDKWKENVLINKDMTNVVACFKCKLIPSNVFTDENGSKIYCKECCVELMNTNKIKKMVENIAFSNMINGLQCRCPHSCADEKMNDGHVDEGILMTNNGQGMCDWKGKYSEIREHLRNECELTKRECKYVKLGCDSNGMNKKELDNHYKKCSDRHENILIHKISELKSNFNEEMKRIRNDMIQLNGIIIQQKQEINQLKKYIQDNKHSDENIEFNPILKSSDITLMNWNKILYHKTEKRQVCIVKKCLGKQDCSIRLKIIELTGNTGGYNSVLIGVIESDKADVYLNLLKTDAKVLYIASPKYSYAVGLSSLGGIYNSYSKSNSDNNHFMMDYIPKHKEINIGDIVLCFDKILNKYLDATIEIKSDKGVNICWRYYNNKWNEFISIQNYDRIKICDSLLRYTTNDILTMKYGYNSQNNKSTIQWFVNDKPSPKVSLLDREYYFYVASFIRKSGGATRIEIL